MSVAKWPPVQWLCFGYFRQTTNQCATFSTTQQTDVSTFYKICHSHKKIDFVKLVQSVNVFSVFPFGSAAGTGSVGADSPVLEMNTGNRIHGRHVCRRQNSISVENLVTFATLLKWWAINFPPAVLNNVRDGWIEC